MFKSHKWHMCCVGVNVVAQHRRIASTRLPSRMTRMMLGPNARHGASVPNGHCDPFFRGQSNSENLSGGRYLIYSS